MQTLIEYNHALQCFGIWYPDFYFFDIKQIFNNKNKVNLHISQAIMMKRTMQKAIKIVTN